MPRLTRLLSSLSSALGPESARLELKWMKEAAERSSGSLRLPAMVERRLRGEPLQYILGTQPFGALDLLVRPPVLIPRPETEDWTLRLSRLIQPSPERPISLLDLCTGSGCIPLLLCNTWKPGSVNAYGVDISEDAIQLATDNAHRCGVHVPAEMQPRRYPFNTFKPMLANIRDPSFLLSAELRPPFHVITSNPPYISRQDFENLPPSVKGYEDHRALIGDPTVYPEPPCSESGKGLTFYHTIAQLLAQQDILTDNGVVALEIGFNQADDVRQIMQNEGKLPKTEVWRDPWNRDRVVFAGR
ncbi:unnamed protein product [Somion occarium]|uniref:S-adenosyl-L-methionine-dependent methyltransferase n=1 Tax=Somion occarium TaxID=3059160 RepID=A0ABP1DHN3_9APHY